MKNFTLFFILLITGLTTNLLEAQGSWTFQTNPLGSGDAAMLGKVQFVSPTEGWISVSSGGLLHTINGGVNWIYRKPFPNETVWSLSDPDIDLCFVNPTTGWLLKSFGTSEVDLHGTVIYKTTNGGNSWQRIVLSQNVTDDLALQIQFVDANNGWTSRFNFSSGEFTFLKSTDGGDNWTQIPYSTPYYTGFLFDFVDTNNGWGIKIGPGLAAPYSIIHTTDGGVNWEEQYNDNTLGELNIIRFTDANNGWVLGLNNKILKTTNGGATWEKITNTGLSDDYNPKCVFFLDANNGWIGTKEENTLNNAIVLHTTNGGLSWEIQNTPSSEAIFSIFFWDSNNGWYTADNGEIGHYSEVFGLDEKNISKSINIYPNPNDGRFYISTKNEISNMKIEIYNVRGQKIYESTNLGQPIIKNEIDLSKHSKGIYFIKVKDGVTTYTDKIIIR